jgi:cytochrome c biogenesis factor
MKAKLIDLIGLVLTGIVLGSMLAYAILGRV